MVLRIRKPSEEEAETIQRLAHSRTEPARTTVRSWLKRFNRRGLAGLQEAPRPGRPAICTLA